MAEDAQVPDVDRKADRLFASRDYACSVAAALSALCVYLLTLAPTVTGEDSGELIAAAYSLGIPHPPGYPTWTMLAHCFTWLPFGTVAWRVNLSSAVFAAATAGLLVLLMRRLGLGRMGAVAGALAFAFCLEFWEQAVIAEVYTLNALFLTTLVLLLLIWREQRRPSQLMLVAVLYGLSLGNHNTMHLCAPFLAAFVLAVERPSLSRIPAYAGLAGLTLATAFLVYLYLPLRSAADPPVDWGNPETLANWWGVVSREQYAFMLTQYPRSLGRFLEQVQMMGGLWLEQFGWSGGIIGAAGLLALARRQRWTTLWLTALALFLVLAFTLAQNPNSDKEWRWVMSVFGIPAYLLTALGIGGAVDYLRGGKQGAKSWAGLVAIFAVLLPLSIHWEHNDKSAFYWVEDYGKNVLESLAPDAVYVAEGDHAAFSTLYLQAVEGLRPDVSLGRKYGYLDMALAPERVAQVGEFPKRRHDPEILVYLLENTGRPLYLQSPLKLPAQGVRLVPTGLAYRALRPGETMPEQDYWARYQWHTLEPEAARGDFTAELILYEIYFTQARQALERGEEKAGLDLLEQALDHYGRDYLVLNNAGVLCAQHDLREEARRYFEEALARDAADGAAQRNLERLLKKASTVKPTK